MVPSHQAFACPSNVASIASNRTTARRSDMRGCRFDYALGDACSATWCCRRRALGDAKGDALAGALGSALRRTDPSRGCELRSVYLEGTLGDALDDTIVDGALDGAAVRETRSETRSLQCADRRNARRRARRHAR